MKKLFLLMLLPVVLSGCSYFRLGAEAVKSGLPAGEELGAFKVGKPYTIGSETYVPQESYSYDETGVASWYGPGFHAKRTANGERFNQREMTAAHRTLQMPSFVRVTNLDNGRSVVLRINDRGPFARGRIIDVSEKAAELLDFKSKGTALVRVQVLPEESRQVAAAAKEGRSWHGKDQPVVMASSRAPAIPRPYENGEPVPVHEVRGAYIPDAVVKQVPMAGEPLIYIQAGAFGDAQNARRLADRLATVASTQVVDSSVNGRLYHRVRVGPVASVREADVLLGQVLAAGASEARIIVD